MYIEVRSIAMKIRRYRFPYGPLEVIVRRRLLRLKMRLGNVASLVSSSVKSCDLPINHCRAGILQFTFTNDFD